MRVYAPLFAAVLLSACGSEVREGRFASTYGDRFCEANAACNSSLECSTEVGDRAGCTYDAEAARACLDGVWTCNTEYEGYEFAQPPVVCGQVWDCTVATR